MALASCGVTSAARPAPARAMWGSQAPPNSSTPGKGTMGVTDAASIPAHIAMAGALAEQPRDRAAVMPNRPKAQRTPERYQVIQGQTRLGRARSSITSCEGRWGCRCQRASMCSAGEVTRTNGGAAARQAAGWHQWPDRPSMATPWCTSSRWQASRRAADLATNRPGSRPPGRRSPVSRPHGRRHPGRRLAMPHAAAGH